MAGAAHPRVGLGRIDGSGVQRLHPRQRRRAPATRSSASSRARWRRQWARTARSDACVEDDRGRRLRARDRVRRHRPLARARLRASSASASSAPASRAAARPARGPALGGRAGLRRGQHEPVDDEARVRRPAARARRHARTSAARCSSPRRTTCRSRATPGGSPRSSRSAATSSPTRSRSSTTRPAGRVLRPRRRRRGRLARRRHDPQHREQLRDAAHRRRSARWCWPSTRELTPFQLKSVLYLTGDNVGRVDGERRPARSGGRRRARRRGGARALLQSIVEVARAIFSRAASSIFLLDEEADELVFEAVAGEGAGELIGRRLPSSTGIAGWVLVTRQPLVLEDVAERPALRARRRREHRLRAARADGRAAAARGARARRAPGARPRRANGSRWRRWICSACSPTRRRSRSTCSSARGARGRARGERGDAVVRSLGWRHCSRARTRRQACGCSRR